MKEETMNKLVEKIKVDIDEHLSYFWGLISHFDLIEDSSDLPYKPEDPRFRDLETGSSDDPTSDELMEVYDRIKETPSLKDPLGPYVLSMFETFIEQRKHDEKMKLEEEKKWRIEETTLLDDGTEVRVWIHEDGKKKEGPYKDGEPHGLWTFWYDGLKVREGNYKDGKKDGIWTIWWKNWIDHPNIWDGIKEGKEHWENGVLTNTCY